MKKFRKEQIEKEIQRVLGRCFLESITFDSLTNGFVTITYVKLAADSSYVDLYVSVLSREKYDVAVMTAELKSKEKFLRKQISDHIPLRHTPVVRIHLDSSIEEGVRISSIIQTLKS